MAAAKLDAILAAVEGLAGRMAALESRVDDLSIKMDVEVCHRLDTLTAKAAFVRKLPFFFGVFIHFVFRSYGLPVSWVVVAASPVGTGNYILVCLDHPALLCSGASDCLPRLYFFSRSCSIVLDHPFDLHNQQPLDRRRRWDAACFGQCQAKQVKVQEAQAPAAIGSRGLRRCR